ncbi:adenosylcobinamide-GDP ribazoletransferase [Sulfidibacter corallicola]|uniref:Adenosylcobinamide-GDP ribazoletransferase n=1 Tax=Sulfidibacter corallicola TaxID=2818388 RepID=A0A8A4TS68_SULCO|nr:adenosylcobinamide-GDP ribazoletransferase [Sulfidibacter corallicola]QTD52390.1 adenosylcobinamide-GDP ribazoletransferase [Sulfidibacter corallicola]
MNEDRPAATERAFAASRACPPFRLAEQGHVFFNALMFFTRIPVPRWVRYSEVFLNQSAAYFPLVGILVGAVGAAVFWLAALVWPTWIAVLLSVVATVLLTGGFHEDGLADVCDGFGGGWGRDRILEIMKDSRLGTFGALGLGLVLGLKVTALAHLGEPSRVAVALIVAHAASRLGPVLIIYRGSYARADLTSKVKPMATGLSTFGLGLAVLWGSLPLALLPLPLVVMPLAVVALVSICLYLRFRREIGGYTGDCLGAIQQIGEVATYLGLLAFLS